MVLVLALAASVSLGAADYLAGVTLRRDGRDDAALTYTAVMLAVGLVAVLTTLPFAPIDEFTSRDVGWSVAAGVAFGLSFPLLMLGMARGPIAVVAPVLGLTALAVPAVAGPLLGDQLSGFEIGGLLLTFPAAVLIALDPHDSADALPLSTAVLVAVGAGGLLGASAVFFGRTATTSGVGPGIVAQLTGLLLLATIGLVGRRLVRPTRAALRVVTTVGVLSGLAVFFSVTAYQRGPVAVVAAILGLAPGLTVLLAWWLIQERINGLQVTGLGLGAIAVMFFAMG